MLAPSSIGFNNAGLATVLSTINGPWILLHRLKFSSLKHQVLDFQRSAKNTLVFS